MNTAASCLTPCYVQGTAHLGAMSFMTDVKDLIANFLILTAMSGSRSTHIARSSFSWPIYTEQTASHVAMQLLLLLLLLFFVFAFVNDTVESHAVTTVFSIHNDIHSLFQALEFRYIKTLT